jgi:hypothetical protein
VVWESITLVSNLNMVVIPIHEFLNELIKKPFTHSPSTMKPWPLQFVPEYTCTIRTLCRTYDVILINPRTGLWEHTDTHTVINISIKVISLGCNTLITPNNSTKKVITGFLKNCISFSSYIDLDVPFFFTFLKIFLHADQCNYIWFVLYIDLFCNQ